MVSGCDVCGDRSLDYCEGCGHHYIAWFMLGTFLLSPIWAPLGLFLTMSNAP